MSTDTINFIITILLVNLQQNYNINSMLSLVDRNLKALSEKQIGKGGNVQHLDISCNQLTKGIQLSPMINLVTLIIDENKFSSLADFPKLQYLETFSANKNNFTDLMIFLEEAQSRFSRLKNLSTLKNPLNPFFEGEQKDHVLDKFPQLQTLDGCAVVIMKKQKKEKLKKQQETYETLKGVAVYDQKYATNQLKPVITKSVGHRFIRNNQL